jgi:hypothetical protein
MRRRCRASDRALGGMRRTFTGLNVTLGLRSFNWNLRYPNAVSFPGLIFCAANTSGPLSPWGRYRLVLTAGGDTDEQELRSAGTHACLLTSLRRT